MMKIFVIQTKMNIEFSDGSFSTWDERPINLYGFKTQKEAIDEVETMREEEVKKYSEWLKKPKNCFIHHYYSYQPIQIFENW